MELRVWGELLVLMRLAKSVNYLKFSPDGRWLMSGHSYGGIRFWDYNDAEAVEPGVWWGHSCGEILCLAYSKDGKQIASGHREGGIQLWNALSGAPGIVLHGHTRRITGISFHPNGQCAASSSQDETVKLWNLSTGAPIAVFSGHTVIAYGVSFSPNGLQIALVGGDMKVRLWEVNPNGQVFDSQGHAGGVQTVTYAPDDLNIVTAGADRFVRRWDTLSGTVASGFFKLLTYFPKMALSWDGSRIATDGFDGEILLWNSRTGEVERTFHESDGEVEELVYSFCGRWVLFSFRDLSLRLWDLQNYEEHQEALVELPREPGEAADKMFCGAFSPNGCQFAVGTAFDNVCLFDPRTRRLLKFIPMGAMIRSLAYSPNGLELAIATESAIFLWDLRSDEPGVELDRRQNMVHCIAYSPCGTWILTGGSDTTIRLWRYQAGEIDRWFFVFAMGGRTEAVLCLAWNPVVPLEFVTGCKDGSVRVWRITICDDGEGVSVGLVWGSGVGRLCVSDVQFKSATGLSPIYQKLLVQRGAHDPLSSEGNGSSDEVPEFSIGDYLGEGFDGSSEEGDDSTGYGEESSAEDPSS